MNELFEPDDAPRRPRPHATADIEYDDELDVDPAFRYVIRPASAASADSPDP